MSGFFKRLGAVFSGKSVSDDGGTGDSEDYNGYTISATPISEGSEYRLSGVITKEIDGEVKEHKFIRADIFSSKDQAQEFTLIKARQMIDQMGDRVFS